MGKAQRIFWGVLAAVIAIVAACGVGYAVAPRDFLQLVLSDSAYTKFTLAKNLSSAYPAGEKILEKVDAQHAAYQTSGAMDVTLDKALFSSEDIASEVSNYINSLTLDSKIYIDGGLLKVTGDLTDGDGSVLTADAIVDTSSAYVKIDQFGTKYMNILKSASESASDSENGNSDSDAGALNATYDAIIEKGADDDLREAIYSLFETAMGSFDNTLISIIPSKTLNLGDLSATGDIATVVMTADDFKACINNTMQQLANDKELFEKINPCLPENEQMTYSQFQSKMLGLARDWTETLEKSGITNVTLEFYIDRKNDIVAFEMWIMSPDSSTGIKAVLFDEDDEGFAVVAERDKEKIFGFNLEKDSADANSGKIEFMNMTESGPLSINASYSGFEMSENLFKTNLKTEKFEVPGQENMGGITLNISASVEEGALSLSARIVIDDFANAIVTLSGKETEFKSFDVPKSEDIEPFDSEAMKAKAVDYVISELPNNSSSFKSLYSDVMESMFGGVLKNLLGNLFPSDFGNSSGSLDGAGIGSALSGILDNIIGENSSTGSFIDDLFSNFKGSYNYSYSTRFK